MALLIINNHDSFTYNLVELVRRQHVPFDVLNVEALMPDSAAGFSHVLISPGPDVPQAYPQLFDFLAANYQQKSILGVCLGLQTLGLFFGGELYNLPQPRHGEQREITLAAPFPFVSLPEKVQVGLYHSWAIKKPLPAALKLLAEDAEGVVMAFAHETLPIFGVQFHPESYMSNIGDALIGAWLKDTNPLAK